MTYTYDDIYGIPLSEYCKQQNTSLNELIQKIKIDIKILKENLKKILDEKRPYPENYIETVIFQTIKKKETHLARLTEWNIETGA